MRVHLTQGEGKIMKSKTYWVVVMGLLAVFVLVLSSVGAYARVSAPQERVTVQPIPKFKKIGPICPAGYDFMPRAKVCRKFVAHLPCPPGCFFLRGKCAPDRNSSRTDCGRYDPKCPAGYSENSSGGCYKDVTPRCPDRYRWDTVSKSCKPQEIRKR